MNVTTNVSAVEANGVGVYRDSECSDAVSSIDWGTLSPGSVKNIVAHVRNEGEEPMCLYLSTTNWNPSESSEYMDLEWNYTEGRRMNPGEVLQVTLTLSISHRIEGISNFGFDILVNGSDRLLGDINGDGKVTGLDWILVAQSLYTTPGDSLWNTNADMDGDGKVTSLDQIIVGLHLFAHWS